MFLLTTSTSTFLNVPYAAQVQQYLIRNPTVECFRFVYTEKLWKIVAINRFFVTYRRLYILLKWFQRINILNLIAWCIHNCWHHILLWRLNCFFQRYWWRHSALLCHKSLASSSKTRLCLYIWVSISRRKWRLWLNSRFSNPLLHSSRFIYVNNFYIIKKII